MGQASPITQTRAKIPTAKVCGERRKGLRLNSAVMRVSRDVFPVKTSHHLSEITGYSVRACEYWLSEKVAIPSDALASLIQSTWGRGYLVAVMADTTPKWWLQLKAWISAIDYAAAEIKHRRKLRELLDDAAAARTDSPAFLIQDEAFYSGQPTPPRALARDRKR